jgi:hypothetical protein
MLYMYLLNAYNVFMKSDVVQYTIRNISGRADQKLREQAATYGISLNQAAVDALERGLNLSTEAVIHHDLDDLIGSWVEDPACDAALRDMRRIDPEMWR